jgi:hypothetical protein
MRVGYQTAILLPPPIAGLQRDARLAPHILDRNTFLGLVQNNAICCSLKRFIAFSPGLVDRQTLGENPT